jgi:sugar lactone lactonase YvrE
VWRCGVERPRLIKRCLCGDVDLARGLVTWAGKRAHALDLASGKRRTWRLPRGFGRVSQAGRTLLLWTMRSDVSDPPAKLRIVRYAASSSDSSD